MAPGVRGKPRVTYCNAPLKKKITKIVSRRKEDFGWGNSWTLGGKSRTTRSKTKSMIRGCSFCRNNLRGLLFKGSPIYRTRTRTGRNFWIKPKNFMLNFSWRIPRGVTGRIFRSRITECCLRENPGFIGMMFAGGSKGSETGCMWTAKRSVSPKKSGNKVSLCSMMGKNWWTRWSELTN